MHEQLPGAAEATMLILARESRGNDQGASSESDRLIELKRIWRVSIAAIARRAHTLGAISDWRYRQINIELSTLGYRTAEPAPVDPEEAAVAADPIDNLRLLGLTRRDLARVVRLSEEEFTDLYLTDDY